MAKKKEVKAEPMKLNFFMMVGYWAHKAFDFMFPYLKAKQ